ncbi:MAG: ComEC/Rec2 family competence protein [Candidatus Bathyarchaeia archaeon]
MSKIEEFVKFILLLGKVWYKIALLTVCYTLFFFFITVQVVLCENQPLVTVYFFDVGQGDAIFIDTEGQDMLIDGGPRSAGSTLMGYLNSLGVSEIAYVVATHPHEDHIGGLISVLESSISVGVVLYNNQSATSQVYKDFMSLAQSKITIVQRGQQYILSENVNFTILNPVQPLEFTVVNSNSIVLQLQAGNVAFLFTGDATFEAEESMMDAGLNLSSQVLKVAHHGSRYATSETFLEAVNPSYAVISAGIGNPYGHPHNETIQRLLSKGVTVYGTYVSETIVMGTDGQTVYVYGNPTPIPEFPQNMTLCFILTLTILIIFADKVRPNNRWTKARV